MTQVPTVKIVTMDGDKFFTLKLFDPMKTSLIETSLLTSYSKSSSCSLSEYMQTLIRLFVADGEKIIDELKEEEEEARKIVLYSYYVGIVTYYPTLSLDNFLTKLNESVFKKYPNKKPKGLPPEISRWDTRLDILGDIESHIMEELQPKRAMPKKAQKGRLLQTKEDLSKLRRYLKANIIGQDEAIDCLVNASKLICTGFADRATFFFLGPTGVGKTQVSKLFAEKFCGRHFKIDCGEYENGHEFNKLIGSPPGYVGHSEENILKKKSQESNCWVFIFDEIEKASPKLFDRLLAWIETGIITDNSGCELDFSKSIFIFTSNVGVRSAKTGAGVGFSTEERTYENAREDILKEMERTFSPEFRNRLDFTVFFNQLSREDIKRIVINEVENNVPIILNNDIINFIIDNGFSAKYGARQLQRFIKTHVSLKVAEAQLDELIPVSGTFYDAEIRDNELFIINTENYNEHHAKTPNEARSTKRSPSTKGGSTKCGSTKGGGTKGGARKRRRSVKKEGSKEEE